MTIPDTSHYVIRGGIQGRERLRVLARVMHPASTSLFDRLGLRDGLACLDVGCGGGDATIELATRVAPRGRAVGVDIDATKVELARAEAASRGVANVEFRVTDIRSAPVDGTFDLVYARFLLTHLSDPAEAVARLYNHLRPGGALAVEDIDFSGYFSYPDSRALRKYQELYCAAVVRRGGDPNIGPRLPSLLMNAGLEELSVAVVQPVGLTGEVKLMNALTMENIKDAVLADGLVSAEEVDAVVAELYAMAADPTMLASTPRIVQTWGRRPR